MIRIIKKLLVGATILLLLSIASPAAAVGDASPGGMPAFSASEVISAINAYRQANGVSPLQYNATLASLAQSHSNYMANTGNITHDEGGTSPVDRAYAAGYGDGQKIFLSEIIFGGWDADVSDAITWWKNSSLHNRVMLDSQYLEIGAGVATSGSTTYFTAEIAWVTTYAAPSDSSSSGSGSSDSSGEDGDSVDFVYSPVMMATPMEDGSITHIVESGQTLWTIAAVYGVDLQTVLDLNNMTSGTWVFPGDQIVIRPPGIYITPSATPENTPEGTRRATVLGTPFSSGPSQTATALPTLEVLQTQPPEATPMPAVETPSEPIIGEPTIRWMIVIAFVIIFGVLIGSVFFQKPPKRPPPKDV